MFRVENNVPDVYVEESRDFQLLSRLYDLVFQSSRFSIDSLMTASDSMHCNDSLLPLISTKVGFFTDSNLTDISHRKILAAFPYIIKYKGSMQGLQLIVNLLGCILNTKVYVEQSPEDKNKIMIYFHRYAPDFKLLEDILYYMRPTGCLIDYTILSDVSNTDKYLSSDYVKISTNVTNSNEIIPVNTIATRTNNYEYSTDIGNTSVNNRFSGTVGFTQIQLTDEIGDNTDA